MQLVKACCAIVMFYIFSAHADDILGEWNVQKDIKNFSPYQYENAKSWTSKQIATMLENNTTWSQLFFLSYGARHRYNSGDTSIIKELIQLVQKNRVIPMTETYKLIIWERIANGDMVFEGRGIIVDDDLFNVAGKANWILRYIYGVRFGLVKINSTQFALDELARRWTELYKGKSAGAVPEEIHNSKTLACLKDTLVLKTLIGTLNPSEKKTQYINTCLEQFKIKSVPKDPLVSGYYCNPDNYTIEYLNKIIELKSPLKTPDAWKRWYEANKSKIVYDEKKKKFVIPKSNPKKASTSTTK
ncbi:MAG: hypothetical protein NZ455_11000 [Bacteroidia bacterium]|nr:hypothetical protein [Bacteroidia bacterium]